LRTNIKVRDEPGRITFSIDGSRTYPSTGEVVDVRTKRIATLEDEVGQYVASEELLGIDFAKAGRCARATKLRLDRNGKGSPEKSR